MKGITAICIATGKVDQFREGLSSFLSQNFDGERELLVVNICWRQELVGEFPNVRIINAKTQVMAAKARNEAVVNAKYDTIVLWDEHGYYLPNFLTQVATAMQNQEWCFLDKEYVFDGNKFNVERGSEFSFSFSKKAWQTCGQFGPGVESHSARSFVGAVTKAFPGQHTSVSKENINFIRIGTAEQRERVMPSIRSGKIDVVPAARMDYGMKLGQMVGAVSNKEICVVELGRLGDIINLLPFLQLVHENYKTPHLMVSAEFADLLEGVSYCKVYPVPLKHEQLGAAMDLAKRTFSIVIRGGIWGVGHTQQRLCDNYNVESLREVGMLHRFDDNNFVPYFDKRDSEREAALVAEHFKTDKPKILVNVSKGVSSPCPHCENLLTEIESMWGKDAEVVNLANIRAHRLYDMLALFEKASCLISIDTSYIHLSAGTKVPVIGILNDKFWATTKIRGGNEVWSMNYEQAKKPDRMKLHESISAALERDNKPIVFLALKSPTKGRVFHLVDRFDDTDPKAASRKLAAFASWDRLYEDGSLIPIHVWDYPRRSKKEIGDTRDLPFVKDLFSKALEQTQPGDTIIWSNDDNLLHPQIAEYARFHTKVYGPCSFLRNELNSAPNSMEVSPEEFARMGRGKHIGRDAFAISHEQLVELVDDMPEWILGAKVWDIQFALIIRNFYKIKTVSNADIAEQIFPAEAPRGYIGHIAHSSAWAQGNMEAVPSNIHNGKLFKYFAGQTGLRVTPEGNLA